jgi:hypothetical protein
LFVPLSLSSPWLLLPQGGGVKVKGRERNSNSNKTTKSQSGAVERADHIRQRPALFVLSSGISSSFPVYAIEGVGGLAGWLEGEHDDARMAATPSSKKEGIVVSA